MAMEDNAAASDPTGLDAPAPTVRVAILTKNRDDSLARNLSSVAERVSLLTWKGRLFREVLCNIFLFTGTRSGDRA
jgi:hypothetical protein